MGKTYDNKIPTQLGFKYTERVVADDRTEVQSLEDLKTLVVPPYFVTFVRDVLDENGLPTGYMWNGQDQTDLANWINPLALLKAQVTAYENGEGKTHPTLVAAMAVDPLPVNTTPFRIENIVPTVDDGKYVYDSGEVDGYKKVGEIVTIKSTPLDETDDVNGASQKRIADYFVSKIDTIATENSTKAVQSGNLFDIKASLEAADDLKTDKTETQDINQKLVTSLELTEENENLYSNNLSIITEGVAEFINLKKGLKYTISASSNDDLINALRFYTVDSSTTLIETFPHGTDFVTGVGFEIIPTVDTTLGVRTQLTNVSVQLDVTYLKSTPNDIRAKFNQYTNPLFEFLNEDTSIVLHTQAGTPTFNVADSIFGGKKVNILCNVGDRGQIKAPFNPIANELYSLGFVYKINSGDVNPNISNTILSSISNNISTGTSRVIDLKNGYKLFLQEGIQYSSSSLNPLGFLIDFNNSSGSEDIEVDIYNPIIVNESVFSGKINFGVGNVFNSFRTYINNLITNVNSEITNIENGINSLKDSEYKTNDLLKPTKVVKVLTDGLKTSSVTTTNLTGASFITGKKYKITFSSDSDLTSGLVFYVDGTTEIANYPNTTDFTSPISFEYESLSDSVFVWRTYLTGSEVNIKIEEISYTSEVLEKTKTNTEITERFYEDYAFYQLLNYGVTTTTTFNQVPPEPKYVGKLVRGYIKAPYTGQFRIYSSDGTTLTNPLLIDATDFTNGVEFEFTIPSDSVELSLRTHTNVVIDEYKLIAKRIIPSELINNNQWVGKKVGLYGNSITAISQGDFAFPFSDQTKWGTILAKTLQFSNLYGRGIGGQRYTWNTGGGSVSFINEDGTNNSRNDSFNLDNYTGSIPAGTTAVRGCYPSWLRITTMFPIAIKDDIDAVIIMGGTNDAENTTSFSWIPNDTTDPEWAASDEYATYGGDYNIQTLEGGIASTIMKFQAWMPQARLIIATPLSGRGATGQLDMTNLLTTDYNKSITIKRIANILSIPVVDVNSKSGINGMNRTDFIADSVHPYSLEGNKALAMAMLGDVKSIYPRII
jgi:hypothetical protein